MVGDHSPGREGTLAPSSAFCCVELRSLIRFTNHWEFNYANAIVCAQAQARVVSAR